MIQFKINCNPPKSTSQSCSRIFKNRSTGKRFIGKTDRNAEDKNNLISLFYPFTPEKPLEGPLRCKIIYSFPWRSTESKKNKAKGFLYNDKSPDIDNINKRLSDILTYLRFWNDDGQVAKLEFEKNWSDEPGIYIEIEELN